jgi:hypothetical protein
LSPEKRREATNLLRRYASSNDDDEKIALRLLLDGAAPGLASHFDRARSHYQEAVVSTPAERLPQIIRRQSAIQCHESTTGRKQPESSLSTKWLDSEIKALVRPASQLWGSKDQPIDSIRPHAVIQGSAQDCFILAPLASIAAARPELIRDMITDNKDGSFTVTFPGARDRKVTVAAPSADDLSKYSRATELGSWVPVIEKAMAKYLKDNEQERTRIIGREVSTAQAADLSQLCEKGGKAAMVLQLLTGSPASGVEIHKRRDTQPSHEALVSAFAADKQNQPVVASIGNSNERVLKAGLTPNHAYSVLAYDPDAKIVTLRDPYGKAMPNSEGLAITTQNGCFRMRLEDFVQHFDELCLGNQSRASGGAIIRTIFKRN